MKAIKNKNDTLFITNNGNMLYKDKHNRLYMYLAVRQSRLHNFNELPNEEQECVIKSFKENPYLPYSYSLSGKYGYALVKLHGPKKMIAKKNNRELYEISDMVFYKDKTGVYLVVLSGGKRIDSLKSYDEAFSFVKKKFIQNILPYNKCYGVTVKLKFYKIY